VYIHKIRVKFVYEGHRIKAKVTGAKKSQMPVRRYSPDGATDNASQVVTP